MAGTFLADFRRWMGGARGTSVSERNSVVQHVDADPPIGDRDAGDVWYDRIIKHFNGWDGSSIIPIGLTPGLIELALALLPTGEGESPSLLSDDGFEMIGWQFIKFDAVKVATGLTSVLKVDGSEWNWGKTSGGPFSAVSHVYTLCHVGNHEAAAGSWILRYDLVQLNEVTATVGFLSTEIASVIAAANAGTAVGYSVVSKKVICSVAAPSATYNGEFHVYAIIHTARAL